jgi:hypothetical protein
MAFAPPRHAWSCDAGHATAACMTRQFERWRLRSGLSGGIPPVALRNLWSRQFGACFETGCGPEWIMPPLRGPARMNRPRYEMRSFCVAMSHEPPARTSAHRSPAVQRRVASRAVIGRKRIDEVVVSLVERTGRRRGLPPGRPNVPSPRRARIRSIASRKRTSARWCLTIKHAIAPPIPPWKASATAACRRFSSGARSRAT